MGNRGTDSSSNGIANRSTGRGTDRGTNGCTDRGTGCSSIKPVGVRDIYALEYQLFQNQIWSVFYIFCVCIFMVHACLGWKKVVPVLGIPKLHVSNVEKFGYAIFFAIGFVYISFPLFVMLSPPFAGHEVALQFEGRVGV